MTAKPPCPNCGSELILDITYGLPSPELYEDKSFFSGGCCLDYDSPAYHCKSCEHEFGYAIPDDENNIRRRELRKLFENNIKEWDKICSDYDYYDHKESYAKAFSIALDAYANKYDMGGDKYLNHSLIIMDFFSIFEERIVALLHNVVQDSDWTLQKIKDEGFSDEIIEAIDSITIRESEDYYDFADRVKMNKIGFRVKLADLGLKMSLKRTPNPTDEDLVKIKKYKETADILIKYHNKAQKTQKAQYAEDDNHPFQTNEISHGGVVSGGDTAKRIIDNVTQTVSFKTYKLIYFQEKYTEKQQQLFDLVMHLKNEGMSYRKIAKYLNGMGHKTHTGKTFTSSSIQFIIKRNKERIQRKKLIETKEVLTYSNFKINFWKEGEL